MLAENNITASTYGFFAQSSIRIESISNFEKCLPFRTKIYCSLFLPVIPRPLARFLQYNMLMEGRLLQFAELTPEVI